MKRKVELTEWEEDDLREIIQNRRILEKELGNMKEKLYNAISRIQWLECKIPNTPSESESESEDEEKTRLIGFISEYGTCEELRNKIGNEGKSYFFDHYTRVPCSYEMYSQFAEDEECWCGCCGLEDEHEEAENEESEEKK